VEEGLCNEIEYLNENSTPQTDHQNKLKTTPPTDYNHSHVNPPSTSNCLDSEISKCIQNIVHLSTLISCHSSPTEGNNFTTSHSPKPTLPSSTSSFSPTLLSESEKSTCLEVKCNNCGKEFKSKYSLTRHLTRKVCFKERTHSLSCNGDLEKKCNNCGKVFKRRDHLIRHFTRKVCFKKRENLITCRKCCKSFSSRSNLLRHDKKLHPKPVLSLCPKCGIITEINQLTKTCVKCSPTRSSLLPQTYDQIGGGKTPINPPRSRCKCYHCHSCNAIFSAKTEFYAHFMFNHNQKGGGELQDTPWDEEENAPWYEDGQVDEDFKRVYNMHASIILQPHFFPPLPVSTTFH
jgi:hypothetical protein